MSTKKGAVMTMGRHKGLGGAVAPNCPHPGSATAPFKANDYSQSKFNIFKTFPKVWKWIVGGWVRLEPKSLLIKNLYFQFW